MQMQAMPSARLRPSDFGMDGSHRVLGAGGDASTFNP
jgi:hypothetical protein